MKRRPRYYESYAAPRYYDPHDKRWYPSHYYPTAHKPYGCLDFLGDVFMITISGGLWLIWIFVREMRRRHVRSY